MAEMNHTTREIECLMDFHKELTGFVSYSQACEVVLFMHQVFRDDVCPPRGLVLQALDFEEFFCQHIDFLRKISPFVVYDFLLRFYKAVFEAFGFDVDLIDKVFVKPKTPDPAVIAEVRPLNPDAPPVLTPDGSVIELQDLLLELFHTVWISREPGTAFLVNFLSPYALDEPNDWPGMFAAFKDHHNQTLGNVWYAWFEKALPFLASPTAKTYLDRFFGSVSLLDLLDLPVGDQRVWRTIFLLYFQINGLDLDSGWRMFAFKIQQRIGYENDPYQILSKWKRFSDEHKLDCLIEVLTEDDTPADSRMFDLALWCIPAERFVNVGTWISVVTPETTAGVFSRLTDVARLYRFPYPLGYFGPARLLTVMLALGYDVKTITYELDGSPPTFSLYRWRQALLRENPGARDLASVMGYVVCVYNDCRYSYCYNGRIDLIYDDGVFENVQLAEWPHPLTDAGVPFLLQSREIYKKYQPVADVQKMSTNLPRHGQLHDESTKGPISLDIVHGPWCRAPIREKDRAQHASMACPGDCPITIADRTRSPTVITPYSPGQIPYRALLHPLPQTMPAQGVWKRHKEAEAMYQPPLEFDSGEPLIDDTTYTSMRTAELEKKHVVKPPYGISLETRTLVPGTPRPSQAVLARMSEPIEPIASASASASTFVESSVTAAARKRPSQGSNDDWVKRLPPMPPRWSSADSGSRKGKEVVPLPGAPVQESKETTASKEVKVTEEGERTREEVRELTPP